MDYYNMIEIIVILNVFAAIIGATLIYTFLFHDLPIKLRYRSIARQVKERSKTQEPLVVFDALFEEVNGLEDRFYRLIGMLRVQIAVAGGYGIGCLFFLQRASYQGYAILILAFAMLFSNARTQLHYGNAMKLLRALIERD